jgi:hypothetical protein
MIACGFLAVHRCFVRTALALPTISHFPASIVAERYLPPITDIVAVL